MACLTVTIMYIYYQNSYGGSKDQQKCMWIDQLNGYKDRLTLVNKDSIQPVQQTVPLTF
jgi:hypothetical protein